MSTNFSGPVVSKDGFIDMSDGVEKQALVQNSGGTVFGFDGVEVPIGGGGGLPTVISETSLSVTTTAAVSDATYAVFASQACTELVIDNNFGFAIEYQRDGTSDPIEIDNGQIRRVVGITNANQIGVRRVDWASGFSRASTITAKAVTSSQTFSYVGTIHQNISSGGGNTQLSSMACTSAEIMNTTGKILTWRIGTGSAYQRIRSGESAIVNGITNLNEIYIKPYDSVASAVRDTQIEAFNTALTENLQKHVQAQRIASDARIQMDDLFYPGTWGTPNWLSIAEQNETRKTLRRKGAIPLALFPTIATSTISQPGACADATNGEILLGTSAVEYTQSVANSTVTFAGASELGTGIDVTAQDIHMDYSLPDNAGVRFAVTGNLANFQIELHSAGSPSAPTGNYHRVVLTQTSTNFIRSDLTMGGVVISTSAPISKFSAVGTGATLTAVTWARISLTGGNGAGANGSKFRPHGIWAVPKARTKAAVVFVFDDLHIGQYTNALPILAKYNYRACIGFDTVVKANSTNFMTPVQIRTLHQRHGWQILGQVQGGIGNGTTSDARISESHAIAQGARFKTAMKALGVSDTEDFSRGSTSFNSDSGAFYPNWQVLKRLYRSSVEFLNGANTTPPFSFGETVPFGDLYSIKRINMSAFTATTWADRWKDHLDQAVADKGAAIYGAHSEFNSAGEGLTALATFVEDLRVAELAGDAENLTMAELIESAY